MFANCQMGGLNNAMPDVCLTPIPTPAGPVPTPIPYPNIAVGTTALPPTAAFKVLMSGMPAHNMMTIIPMSNGDNAGVNMGVLSGMVMGPSRHLTGAFTTLVGGSPATKMTSMTGQNGMSLNVPGMTLVPAQFKVLMLK
ncbi:MAG TPA: DUF4150 domain-containing protein [Thiotrichales bacterium]|nr:DUF4150 domain-containing protein [Thiotrichales bacterium]